MMKSFREWLSCHSLSKSLLSASPFSFFYAEPKDGDFGSHVISSQTTHSSENQQNISLANPQPPVAEPTHPDQYNVNQGDKDPLGQVEAFQIKFLRLVHRIGQSPSNPVVSKVLYRLELASLIRAGESNLKRPGLKIDKARAIASALEESKQDDFEFSFRILVLGKTGVGKSALINSLFDEERVATNAFQPATGCIQLVAGTVKGIKVTVIDTPGLLPSNNNQLRNRRILSDIKKFIRKSPPDAILYVERLDVLNRGYNDFPLLKLITDVFGSSIWFNTILVMTHCSSPLPEGPDGYPINYEAFVSRCADLLQYGIQQMVPTMQLVCPLLLVESHHMCMKNSKGEKVLPNGQAWVSQFLLLCTATKVLCDANSS
ncbi:hypothetical protein HPP92_019666 [Vanilla planifolia]|uniref:AIG1-type G domain-containing protein n=1 Tax=Vanilla planifolia TaxID=51239 RepID=A0A835Q3A6_VANPL|nr:hypothetical protein HPP92_019665 [Vanilla planifolia]KAG0465502.1 hypothetical protein HPP92_019666 [Vanilla planifolia]